MNSEVLINLTCSYSYYFPMKFFCRNNEFSKDDPVVYYSFNNTILYHSDRIPLDIS